MGKCFTTSKVEHEVWRYNQILLDSFGGLAWWIVVQQSPEEILKDTSGMVQLFLLYTDIYWEQLCCMYIYDKVEEKYKKIILFLSYSIFASISSLSLFPFISNFFLKRIHTKYIYKIHTHTHKKKILFSI